MTLKRQSWLRDFKAIAKAYLLYFNPSSLAIDSEQSTKNRYSVLFGVSGIFFN
jgi:hypothetical protein